MIQQLVEPPLAAELSAIIFCLFHQSLKWIWRTSGSFFFTELPEPTHENGHTLDFHILNLADVASVH